MKGTIILMTLGILTCMVPDTMAQDYAGMIKTMAQRIEALKPFYPQLQQFSVTANVNPERLIIDYEFHTHQPSRAGGWTDGVPHPDNDGIWFYIDLHDADSMAQIHTQPITGTPMCLGNKRVTFLILEGAKTKSISSALWQILREHGAKECAHQ